MTPDTVLGVCALTATAMVALVLVAESGLLIGVALPAGSLVLGLGVLAGAGAVPPPLAALSVAAATMLGAALGHRRARRRSGGQSLASGVLVRRLPGRATRLIDRTTTPWRESIGRRPVRTAATAQFIVGARTLAPRLAASAGVPLATMLRGTAPAALVWSSALVATGALAGAALSLVRDLLTVAGIPLALGLAAWLLLRRRARAATTVLCHGATVAVIPSSAHQPDRVRAGRFVDGDRRRNAATCGGSSGQPSAVCSPAGPLERATPQAGLTQRRLRPLSEPGVGRRG